MEGFQARGWELIRSRCGGTAALARDATLAARLAPEASANQQSASGTGISTPCGAVSTREYFCYGFGLLEL